MMGEFSGLDDSTSNSFKSGSNKDTEMKFCITADPAAVSLHKTSTETQQYTQKFSLL